MDLIIRIQIDTNTAERAAVALPLVQQRTPKADLAYVYRGAAQMGLRNLETTPTEIEIVNGAPTDIALEAAEMKRARTLAAARGVTAEALLSAAVRSGVHQLVPDELTPGMWRLGGER